MVTLILIAVVAVMAFVLLSYLLWLVTGDSRSKFILGIAAMAVLIGLFIWLFYLPLYHHIMETTQAPAELEKAPTLENFRGEIEPYSGERLCLNLTVSISPNDNGDGYGELNLKDFVPGNQPGLAPVIAIYYPYKYLEPVRATHPFYQHSVSVIPDYITDNRKEFSDFTYTQIEEDLSQEYQRVYLTLDKFTEVDSWEKYQSDSELINDEDKNGKGGEISEELYFQLSENVSADLMGDLSIDQEITAVLLYTVDPGDILNSDDHGSDFELSDILGQSENGEKSDLPSGIRLIHPDNYKEYLSSPDNEIVNLPVRELDMEVNLNDG